MRRSVWISIFGAFAAQTVLVQQAEAGQNDAVLIGVVKDASTGQGVEGAVVVITGEKLQGERVRTTDISGLYRIPNLPPGTYELTVIHKDYAQGQKRTGLKLQAGQTIRFDTSLVPSGAKDSVTIIVESPTVDVVSSGTGMTIDKEMSRRVPIAVPTGKGGASRSFESVAEASPTAANDTYGTSVSGTTSPENKYYVDGLSTNDPGFGLNGTGLSVEFIEEVRVETGGYMPEYGRATGGIVSATTKTGSNQFHGSVWGNYTPGALEGRREIPARAGSSIITERTLGWLGDAGFNVGGRLIKDKLWFFGGVQVSRTVYDITTSINRSIVNPETGIVDTRDPDTGKQTGFDMDTGARIPGVTATERVYGSSVLRKAQGTTVQALGKLTYTPHRNHTLELLGIYAPTVSGGHDAFGRETYGLDARTGQPEIVSGFGTYNTLARRYRDNSGDLQLKWNATSADNKWNVDTTVGWHHQVNEMMAADGSRLGDKTGLATVPGVIFRRNAGGNFHSLSDFPTSGANQAIPTGTDAGACDPVAVTGMTDVFSNVCPVTTFATGGPGFLYNRKLERIQARSMATRLAQAAGHHLIKFGIDFEYNRYQSQRGYSGATLYRENAAGTAFSDFRNYGYLTSPDQATVLPSMRWTTFSTTIGGFLQDSWTIMDKVTVNAGVRYDAQHLFGGDGQMTLALPNQISPRLGLVWDPTQAGHAKLFFNYARFYQSVPLNLADRAGSGEPGILSSHRATDCNPLTTKDTQTGGGCTIDANRNQLGGATEPDQKWVLNGGGKTPIDPKVRPQSSDEIVVGGEYEVFADARLGARYTHRWLNRVIEDMSRDEAATYFIGNPGHGIAKDFPKATRNYDAVVAYLEKRFARHWLISSSYTLAWLKGNLAGLFRPETGQLDPNINSDFDLRSLLDNRTGFLPGDTRHAIKVFIAGEIPLRRQQAILLGGAARGNSGGPTNVLASHNLYGPDESFILPRGTGERLPWNFRIDGNIGYMKQITKDVAISVTMDVFNIANFQQVIATDQTYTQADVLPIKNGTLSDLKGLKDGDGNPVVKNPNFGRPIAYQQPRMFRFGIRLTF